MGRDPSPKVCLVLRATIPAAMTTPSQPVAIKSPGLAHTETEVSTSFTPSGTPNLHALRTQYAGTPPMPNIPPRGSTPAQRNGPPAQQFLPTPDAPSPLRHGSQAVGGLSATAVKSSNSSGSGVETPPIIDLDGLPEEEKVRVLGRHLVSKQERKNILREDADLDFSQSLEPGTSSRQSSSSQNDGPIREDSEPFPIPYHAPGADVT